MIFILLVASFYLGTNAPGEGGIWTVTGRKYDAKAFTAAHKTLPLGTILHVCRGRTCVGVTINDRGPFVRGRDLDLSVAAARALHMTGRGVAKVRVAVPIPRPRPDEADAWWFTENSRALGL